MLFQFVVQLFHLLVTDKLFVQEFVLASPLPEDVEDARVRTIFLELVKVQTADLALAGHVLALLEEVRYVSVCLFFELQLVGARP